MIRAHKIEQQRRSPKAAGTKRFVIIQAAPLWQWKQNERFPEFGLMEIKRQISFEKNNFSWMCTICEQDVSLKVAFQDRRSTQELLGNCSGERKGVWAFKFKTKRTKKQSFSSKQRDKLKVEDHNVWVLNRLGPTWQALRFSRQNHGRGDSQRI